MDTKTFRRLIKDNLKPILNDMGFKGTDHHFIKKTNGHYIYTLVIQANIKGGACIMEMGVGIDCVDLNRNNKITTVYDCEFRKRIKQEITFWDRVRGNTLEKWHDYGENENQALKTISKMSKLFKVQGPEFYGQFDQFPNPLSKITIEELISGSNRIDNLGSPPKLRLALILSKTHQYIGNKKEQISFAEWGLRNIGNASALEEEFRKLIQDV